VRVEAGFLPPSPRRIIVKQTLANGSQAVDEGGRAGPHAADAALQTNQGTTVDQAGKHTAAGADSTEGGMGGSRKVQPFQLSGAQEMQVVYRAQDRQVPLRQIAAQPLQLLAAGPGPARG